jgi:hypothetical protein
MSYIVFLGLYSYFVLVDMSKQRVNEWPSAKEYVLWGWVVTLITEEFREVDIILFHSE